MSGKMKYSLVFLACALVAACSTTRKPSPGGVVREAHLILSRAREVRKFEDRLDELGARIEKGQTVDERVATVALPGKPGYFPPRTLRVVYQVTDKGMVVLKVAELTSLSSHFTRDKPNQVQEPTTVAVTSRAMVPLTKRRAEIARPH
jgi:hypothetical protein